MWKTRLYWFAVKKKADLAEGPPADVAGFERFQTELLRLVAKFERGFKQVQSADYNEAKLRMDFLDPLFLALGWDITNDAELIPQHREVEIESRTEVSGRQKRADYLFRTDRQDRFVCEAKKPAEKLHAGYAFQAKRYAWNKGLVLAVLSDFEELKIYLVGSKPRLDDAHAGEWRTWHFLEYAQHARAMWDLLSRDAVAAGSIEKLVASLPRKPAAKTKAKQQWLFKPDRARAIDADFLDFLDEARRGLASDLIRRNDRADLLEGSRLDEAVQRILDRLLFLRICEDRDIDTGRPLATILKVWRDRKDTPLWRDIVAHFRALDRRPASHIPYFNGNLFKEHFSETLEVGDEWLSGFLEETGDDESAYLFNVIPVEILGTIYERFLGKTVRPHGRGVVIEEKPEVRKAGGVYYTPRYIVDYIVEQTLGKLLENKAPLESLKLRVLDPACGSGSFLIRAYERLCEHWQIALTKNESLRRKADCWTDPDTGDVHLTSDLKRRILVANIYGVDLDPGAVEVSQLSLYLKMLEGENRASLAKNRELFGPDAPLLPPLQDNIKCGNSLIASDFSLNPDDFLRVRAFDWPEGFRDIMQAGGFDVVAGNPPYIPIETMDEPDRKYYQQTYPQVSRKFDTGIIFILQALRLVKSTGLVGYISSITWETGENFAKLREAMFVQHGVVEIINLPFNTFADAYVDTGIYVLSGKPSPSYRIYRYPKKAKIDSLKNAEPITVPATLVQEPDYRIVLDPTAMQILMRAANSEGSQPLGALTKSTQGLATNRFKRTNSEQSAEWYPFDEQAKSHRYDYVVHEQSFAFMQDFQSLRQFYEAEPKLLIRRIINRQDRLVACYCNERMVFKKDINPFVVTTAALSPKYLLGIINSRLISYIYVNTSAIATKDDFRQTTLAELRRIPIPSPSSRALHDKLVALVDKMLLLVPKLRAAKSDGDRATLENAVAATDRAIDALVYELYGLTADEIALVEGSAK